MARGIRSRRPQLKGLTSRLGISTGNDKARRSWDRYTLFLVFATIATICYLRFLFITLREEARVREETTARSASSSASNEALFLEPDNPQQAWILKERLRRQAQPLEAVSTPEPSVAEVHSSVPARSEAELLEAVNSMLAKVGKCSIPDWNGHRGAYTFSFDDGSDGMVTFAPLVLNENNIRGTFFITPIFVDPPTDNPKPAQLPDKWPFILRMHEAGHEIGGHTTSHRNFFHEANETFIRNDFTEAVRRLEKEVPGLKGEKYTMAYPFGANNELSRREASKHYLAARTIQCGMMSASRFTSEDEFYVLNGCSHGRLPKAEKANKLLDSAIASNNWVVLIMHGIGSCISDRSKWVDDHSIANYREGIRSLETGQLVQCRYGYSAVNPQVFEAHVRYAAKMRDMKGVWIAPMVEVVKYLRQQQSHTVQVQSVSKDMKRIALVISRCVGCSHKPKLPDKMVPMAVEIHGESKMMTLGRTVRAYSVDQSGRELPTKVSMSGPNVKVLIQGIDVSRGEKTKVILYCCSVD